MELLLGPDFVQDASKKVSIICQRLLTAQSRQKKYVDHRRTVLWFREASFVFLRVDAKKGLKMTLKLGKLAPRYNGPFRIEKRIGSVAYKLDMPPQLSRISAYCV